MKAILCIVLAGLTLALTGCGSVPRLSKTGEDFNVIGNKDAGTPATVESGGTVTTVPLPVGSTVETVPPVPPTASNPGVPAAVKVTLAAQSELRTETRAERASTGTVDTSVAKHRIDKEQASKDREPLLWAAIGSLVAGVVFVVLQWPGVATIAFVAAGCFFAAWKLAEVPWWAGLLAVVAGAALFLGYKRGKWDADGDGTPDFLERGKK